MPLNYARFQTMGVEGLTSHTFAGIGNRTQQANLATELCELFACSLEVIFGFHFEFYLLK